MFFFFFQVYIYIYIYLYNYIYIYIYTCFLHFFFKKYNVELYVLVDGWCTFCFRHTAVQSYFRRFLFSNVDISWAGLILIYKTWPFGVFLISKMAWDDVFLVLLAIWIGSQHTAKSWCLDTLMYRFLHHLYLDLHPACETETVLICPFFLDRGWKLVAQSGQRGALGGDPGAVGEERHAPLHRSSWWELGLEIGWFFLANFWVTVISNFKNSIKRTRLSEKQHIVGLGLRTSPAFFPSKFTVRLDAPACCGTAGSTWGGDGLVEGPSAAFGRGQTGPHRAAPGLPSAATGGNGGGLVEWRCGGGCFGFARPRVWGSDEPWKNGIQKYSDSSFVLFDWILWLETATIASLNIL